MCSVLFSVLSVFLILSDGLRFVVTTNHNDPIMFVFGDSNSDTGGSNAAFGGLTQYPIGNIFPYPPSERQSDGRIIIDFLCENVTTNYLEAYLNSLEPNFGNGANFAVRGASATFSSFRLETQINQFERFHNRSLTLQSKGHKLVGKKGFKRALYIIDIGQNDLEQAFDKASFSGMIEKIPSITFEIKKAVQRIYDKGRRRFWMHNTGALGCLPSQLALRKPDATDLDQHGCIKYLNEGAQMFNRNLSELCEDLRVEMKDSTIVYLDVYAIKYDLIANANRYGE